MGPNCFTHILAERKGKEEEERGQFGSLFLCLLFVPLGAALRPSWLVASLPPGSDEWRPLPKTQTPFPVRVCLFASEGCFSVSLLAGRCLLYFNCWTLLGKKFAKLQHTHTFKQTLPLAVLHIWTWAICWPSGMKPNGSVTSICRCLSAH